VRKLIQPLVGIAAVLVIASPLAAQGYGTSAAVSGTDALVGESLNVTHPGYVYVYRKDGSGTWVEAQRLQASDAFDGDHFGRAVSAVGDEVIIGATVVSETTGAVYVFAKEQDGSWAETAKLTASDGVEGDAFGRTLANDGTTLLVGALAHGGAGAVYVFRHNEVGEWVEDGKLMADDGEDEDFFGLAVSVEGDLAVVGAPLKNMARGAAYVFQRSDTGTWSQVAKVEIEDLEQNANFGISATFVHGAVAVGAPGDNGFIGSVRLFSPDDAGEWTERATYNPFDGGGRGTRFGGALAFVDNNLWIGAAGAGGFEGRAYVMEGDPETMGWVGVSKFSTDDLERGDGLSSVMAFGDDVAIMGLQGDDFGSGTALILERSGDEYAVANKVWSETVALEAITGDDVQCEEGQASLWSCTDVDIVSYLPIGDIGGPRGVRVNDVWGWTDPETGVEWALIGRMEGTAFVSLEDPSNPVFVGSLPLTEGANPAAWRDIKVYNDHAYVVADGAGNHGMQIFDLRQLRDVASPPVTFEMTAHYDRFQSTHNIVINEETGYAYSVGTNGGGDTCGGGLHMINIQDPLEPTFVGCFADSSTGRSSTGYSHDAQCIIYDGPDREHAGQEICFGANETALSIADVTDKDAPVALSTASYPNVAYSHQGWIDEEHEYFYMNDELDELGGNVAKTRTLIWDVKDLDDPILVKEYLSENEASDHNLYIRGDLMYQSNYVSGLRILDISSREDPREVAFFDTVPWGEDAPGFDGSWSNYPYFESGIIIVTSAKEGVFFLRKADRNPIS